MSDLMREEFEQRFPVPRGVLWRDGAYHREKEKQCTLMAHLFYLGRWEAWQVSRECLVIELPKPYAWDNDGGFDRESDPDSECSMALIPTIDVMQSIHAAGVKTK